MIRRLRLQPILALLPLIVAGAALSGISRGAPVAPSEPLQLAPVRALGVQVDTLFIGGYARGSFTEALGHLSDDLAEAERTLFGEHLEKIFAEVDSTAGLGRAGRLRVAYERARRPDGSTRSIRVLAAELAIGGKLHTAYLYERGGKPGYFDAFGRSLDPQAWTGPLASLRVTSRFGLRRMHPILRRVLPHAGVDYAASAGTPVRATADGIVAAAGRRGGYGNLVEIQHPSGYSTRYAHLSRIAPGIEAPRRVRQGEVIGFVGATGLATGPHLHYEVRRQGQPVDPLRVSAESGISADLGAESGWATGRRDLGGLLARTPEM